MIARRIRADVARVGFGEIEAHRAMANARLHVADCVSKLHRIGRLLLEQVKRDPLGRPRADARQGGELVHQILNRLRVVAHGVGL